MPKKFCVEQNHRILPHSPLLKSLVVGRGARESRCHLVVRLGEWVGGMEVYQGRGSSRRGGGGRPETGRKADWHGQFFKLILPSQLEHLLAAAAGIAGTGL